MTVREFLRGAVTLHVLHHAVVAPVNGAWLTDELRRHGYRISPGTLYPLLHRLETDGLLVSSREVVGGRARRAYAITGAGLDALDELRHALTRAGRRGAPGGRGLRGTTRTGHRGTGAHVRAVTVTVTGDETPSPDDSAPDPDVPIATVAREWLRIGCVGFGGPPTHIALLRRLCVEERGWISPDDFEHAIAATNLLPGPASTQLAIWCAWRLRRNVGAVVGGVCFIVPGLVLILGLSILFLSSSPPVWVRGAAAGAGAAVAAVAVNAAAGLLPSSWARTASRRGARVRWAVYLAVGGASAATAGPFLVVALIACGLTELGLRRLDGRAPTGLALAAGPAIAAVAAVTGGIGGLAWVALKVGALSFGGGFVIVPLMQADAVHHYHWMTNGQFLNAVALGQITPGPVVQTVAAVGYAAAGIGGGLIAAVVAFAPSFAFVLVGAPHLEEIRANKDAGAFLSGAGPAAIGAIAGSAIPLGLALAHLWQLPVLAGAALWLLAARRGVVSCLLAAGAVGVGVALAGVPVGR